MVSALSRSSKTKNKAKQLPTPDPLVVLETGSGSVKAGFAGEKKPKVVFRNVVGRLKEGAECNNELLNMDASVQGSNGE